MEALFAAGWSALVPGAAVLGAAGLATAALRRSSAAARHGVWVAALIGMAVLAVGAAVPADWVSQAGVFDIPAIQVLAGAGRVSPPGGINAPWLLLVWGGVASALLFSLAASHARALLLVRRAPEMEESVAGVRLRESPAGQGPMTWGFFRPVVLLPREACSWQPEVRQAVLTHELAHCARQDCSWLLLSRAIASVFWFQPLAWWAIYRISEESERAADDAVLRSGIPAGEYAEWLLKLARSMRGEPRAALAMSRSSELEGRLNAVLNERVNRRGVSRAGVLALSTAVCLALLPVAAAQKSKTDDKVYKIGGSVSAPSPIKKVEPQYTEEAREAKLAGSVLLKLHIDKDGSPQDVTVVKGLAMGLSENAVAAVKQWKFKPGMKDGKPVRVMANIEVNFRLN